MLDQQPRWLRPGAGNMGNRLAELTNSPTRTAPGLSAPVTRARAVSDLSPYTYAATDFKSEPESTPSPLGLSPHSAVTPDFVSQHYGFSPTHDDARSDTSFQDFRSQAEANEVEEALLNFVRKTTFMSTNTDTGSFQEILTDRSQTYVQAVRRLVKRFTIPVNSEQTRPRQSDDHDYPSTWINEPDCPHFLPGTAYFLPGDYTRQRLTALYQLCDRQNESHMTRKCVCAWVDELPPSPWVELGSYTQRAQVMLSCGPQPADIALRDSCGNTLLHFVAANEHSLVLHPIIRSGSCDRILNTKNTAGQTFLHLADSTLLNNIDVESFFKMLISKGFDFGAKDHYGRTIFHTLLANGVPQNTVYLLLQLYGLPCCNTRDAFGVIPAPSNDTEVDMFSEPSLGGGGNMLDTYRATSTPSSPNPQDTQGRLQESRVIENVRVAAENPNREDAFGANGLQNLASAKLSLRNVLDRGSGRLRAGSDRGPRRGDRTPDNDVDSSSKKMQLRFELAEGLIAAGVDPNHYDKHGHTPLMAFAAELPEENDYKFGPSLLAMLIKNGAKVNARSKRGETALHIAVRCGRKLAVKALVANGANIHARDADGRSALDVADMKVKGARHSDPRAYAHFEACRAWLSGNDAVQSPTILQEWGPSHGFAD